MQTFIYRWQERAGADGARRGEVDGPVLEIRGDAYSLWSVAKRLELPVRPFWSEFTDLDGNPADIWDASADEFTVSRAACTATRHTSGQVEKEPRYGHKCRTCEKIAARLAAREQIAGFKIGERGQVKLERVPA